MNPSETFLCEVLPTSFTRQTSARSQVSARSQISASSRDDDDAEKHVGSASSSDANSIVKAVVSQVRELLTAHEGRIIESISSIGSLVKSPSAVSKRTPGAATPAGMSLTSSPLRRKITEDGASSMLFSRSASVPDKSRSGSKVQSSPAVDNHAREMVHHESMQSVKGIVASLSQLRRSKTKESSTLQGTQSILGQNRDLRASPSLRQGSKSSGWFSSPRKKTKVVDEISALVNLTNDVSRGGMTRAMRKLSSKDSQCTEVGLPDHILQIMNSRQVELAISIAISCNAVVMGIQVDTQMRSPTDGRWDPVFRTFDIFFLIIFAIELILRLMGESPCEFFGWYNDKLSWNCFDAALVLSSFVEEVVSFFMDSSPDVSTIRLFRILRLVRVFRIIRVMRFFRDLRIMVAGIAQSMQSLVWALLLLFSIMYLVAICVMQIAVEENETRANNSASAVLNDDEYNLLQKFFGSLDHSLYTLYQSITSGVDWGEAADVLFALTWVLGVFYAMYIAFGVLCVLNIVTGVFVENCNKMTALDHDMVLMEQLETRRAWFEEARQIFDVAEDGSGSLSAWEFTQKLQEDVRMQAWLRKIGVHVETHSAESLFQLLDIDGDGQLDFDEFASALQQVHGTARSIDVAKIAHDTRVIRGNVARLMTMCGRIEDYIVQKNIATTLDLVNSEVLHGFTDATDNRPRRIQIPKSSSQASAPHGIREPRSPTDVLSCTGSDHQREIEVEDFNCDNLPRMS